MTIQIDLSRDNLLTSISKVTIKEKYALPTEQSPQESFARAAQAFATDEDHAQRIYDYASKLWFMFSTPILSNGGTDKGMPISCFVNYVGDSRQALADHYTENIWLSSMGGGIGGCWDAVRSSGTGTSRGTESTGIIPFMHVVDSQMLAFQQGISRRGKYSFNLNVSHPEIEEFIDITNKKGGDTHRRAQHSFNCVSISDAFMKAVSEDGDWPLIDPHTKTVKKTVRAWDLWTKILTSRLQEGVPYLHFVDISNRHLPIAQQKLGLKISQTNLCSEIILPTSEERTAVCCLSSVNLEKWDEWKDDPKFIPDLVEFLDNVLAYFIENAPEGMSKAVYSASRERSIGIGAMGWHSLLQSKLIPFESALAISMTRKIFSQIKEQAEGATKLLAIRKEPCPDSLLGSSAAGELRRNMHLMAIAPNATSSIICGNTSPSIEPIYSNYFTQRTQNGTFIRKNVHLQKHLLELGKDTKEVWDSIKINGGSCQHLEFLSDDVKKVFKTAFEIEQTWIIEQAAHRQEFICQSQSLNLFLRPDEDKEYIHALHYLAWLKGVKTLYYVRSKAPKKADLLSEKVDRQIRSDFAKETAISVGEVGYSVVEESTCFACEG